MGSKLEWVPLSALYMNTYIIWTLLSKSSSLLILCGWSSFSKSFPCWKTILCVGHDVPSLSFFYHYRNPKGRSIAVSNSADIYGRKCLWLICLCHIDRKISHKMIALAYRSSVYLWLLKILNWDFWSSDTFFRLWVPWLDFMKQFWPNGYKNDGLNSI